MSDLTRPGITGIALDSSLRRYEQALAVADLADHERTDLYWGRRLCRSSD